MLTFNQYRSFISIKQRDEYNSEPILKEVIYINPVHVIAVEKVKFTTYETYGSSYEIARIYTLKGVWLVEGNAEDVSSRIDDATR